MDWPSADREHPSLRPARSERVTARPVHAALRWAARAARAARVSRAAAWAPRPRGAMEEKAELAAAGERHQAPAWRWAPRSVPKSVAWRAAGEAWALGPAAPGPCAPQQGGPERRGAAGGRPAAQPQSRPPPRSGATRRAPRP